MFLYFDESLIKWCQWGVRQIELFMGVRVRALFKGLVVFYIIALVIYGLWFSVFFTLLQDAYFLFAHMVALLFFIAKLLLLGAPVKNWLALPFGYAMRHGRRRQREWMFIILTSFLGSLLTYAVLSPVPAIRLVEEWCAATVVLVIMYLSLEYTLCTEAVSLEEYERRQKRT